MKRFLLGFMFIAALLVVTWIVGSSVNHLLPVDMQGPKWTTPALGLMLILATWMFGEICQSIGDKILEKIAEL